MTTTQDPLLVTANTAAELLAISTRKLWQLTNSGELPAVRIGRAVRYDPSALKAWVQSMKGKGTT